MKIGILCSPDMMPVSAIKNPYDAEGKEQLSKLIPALHQRGISMERIEWRNSVERAREFDAVLPLFAWDYWDHCDHFLHALSETSKLTKVINSPSLIEWNTDKKYLQYLGRRGVPIVPTEFVERLDFKTAEKSFDAFGSNKVVIKPRIGGGGFGQTVIERSSFSSETKLLEGPVLLQPFLKSVQSEGEITTVWFGDRFSHALRKVPQDGDYRVQSHYGGHEEFFDPAQVHIETAKLALDALPEKPLYSRIDLLTGNDGDLKVSEVELIEPYFYLAKVPSGGAETTGAELFADTLAARLS